jgi:hypothetical protein
MAPGGLCGGPMSDTPRIPAPWTMAGLREMPDPEEKWLAQGWAPEDANVLWAGYPKTFKTMLLQELAVALATATPFLGRFKVPERRRVGLILMEDARHRARRRYERIAAARGLTLWDSDSGIDGIFTWFRPPLRLSSVTDLEELAGHIEERGIEYLHIDSWAYVATGNSNDADEVTPQLQALSQLRQRFEGLTVGLTHHARKTIGDGNGDRLTDLIRNSSAFGAWYDVGVVLARRDEMAPVTVRAELRDYPSPDPFAFKVEDEHPAGPDFGPYPGGAIYLRATDTPPALVERSAAAERLAPAVATFLATHPGCSKRQLRDGIGARNPDVEAAFDLLVQTGRARFDEPEKRGQAGRCYPTVPHRAPTVPRAHPGDTVPGGAPHTPLIKGVGPGHGQSANGPGVSGGARSEGEFDCPTCGNPVGSRGVRCAGCAYTGNRRTSLELE